MLFQYKAQWAYALIHSQGPNGLLPIDSLTGPMFCIDFHARSNGPCLLLHNQPNGPAFYLLQGLMGPCVFLSKPNGPVPLYISVMCLDNDYMQGPMGLCFVVYFESMGLVNDFP